jgi:hypothetical protein
MKLLVDVCLSPAWTAVFGTLLALMGARCPSVVQLRAQDVMPDVMAEITISALRQFERELEAGALVTIDVARARAKLLPLRSSSDWSPSYPDATTRGIKITYKGRLWRNTQLEYDTGARCSKILERTSGSITGSLEFIWDGTERCVEIEKNSSGTITATKTFFALGEQITVPPSTVTNLFYTLDHPSSIREVVDHRLFRPIR